MIPLLIISNDIKQINQYVNNLKKDDLFFEITTDGKEYSIKDIRGLIKETSIFNPKKRVYFLADFHLSSIEAQNSFLKLLEEPPKNIQFILSSDNSGKLLPTIISRTKTINLSRKKMLLINKGLKKKLEELILKKNLKILGEKEFCQIKREEAMTLLDEIIFFFRERMIDDRNATIIIKELLRLKNLLENNNLNPQLTVDHLLIYINNCYNLYKDYENHKKR